MRMSPSTARLTARKLGNKFTVRKNSRTVALYLLLTAILIFSCAPSKESLRIEFRPYYNNQALNCDLSFQHEGENWSINTLGMFASSFSISTLAGSHQKVELIDSNWQSSKTALLWFKPNCEHDELPNNQYNRHITMQIDPSNFSQTKQLAFTMAVPFAENHANPLTQAAPLNNPEMFWSWQTGHKFMRFDIKQIDDTANWAFHLGSVGCTSKSTLRAPKGECAQPNRVKLLLDIPERQSENSDTLVIQLNIETLLVNVDITSSQACMFTLNQLENCRRVMQNLSMKPVFSASWQGQKL